MNEKLKKVIFSKLYRDLDHIEIIEYKGSICFIDRNEKYWYLEYKKSGNLYWRYDFFTNFFKLFSMERDEFQPIISDWVEEVLNYKVTTTGTDKWIKRNEVEEILNCKVTTTKMRIGLG